MSRHGAFREITPRQFAVLIWLFAAAVFVGCGDMAIGGMSADGWNPEWTIGRRGRGPTSLMGPENATYALRNGAFGCVFAVFIAYFGYRWWRDDD